MKVTDSLEGFDAPDSSNSLRELDLQDLRSFIQILMHDLSPKAAGVLGDFYLKGFTQNQIAARHNLALNSVGVNLTRSLQRILQIMKKNPTLMKEIHIALQNIE